jgi:hypothetical protein
VTRLKKKKKINLKRKRGRSHKVISNALITGNKGIMREIATQKNKMGKPK